MDGTRLELAELCSIEFLIQGTWGVGPTAQPHALGTANPDCRAQVQVLTESLQGALKRTSRCLSGRDAAGGEPLEGLPHPSYMQTGHGGILPPGPCLWNTLPQWTKGVTLAEH